MSHAHWFQGDFTVLLVAYGCHSLTDEAWSGILRAHSFQRLPSSGIQLLSSLVPINALSKIIHSMHRIVKNIIEERTMFLPMLGIE